MLWMLVFAGGGIGALLRFELGGLVQARAGPSFPWGTFAVNVIGCAAIGLLATWIDEREIGDARWRTFLVTGVLGGFTTFSAFGLETWRLLEDGAFVAALANALGSVVACVVAVAFGVAIARNV